MHKKNKKRAVFPLPRVFYDRVNDIKRVFLRNASNDS